MFRVTIDHHNSTFIAHTHTHTQRVEQTFLLARLVFWLRLAHLVYLATLLVGLVASYRLLLCWSMWSFTSTVRVCHETSLTNPNQVRGCKRKRYPVPMLVCLCWEAAALAWFSLFWLASKLLTCAKLNHTPLNRPDTWLAWSLAKPALSWPPELACSQASQLAFLNLHLLVHGESEIVQQQPLLSLLLLHSHWKGNLLNAGAG